MGLIHRQQGDQYILQQLGKARRFQPLRCDIQDLIRPAPDTSVGLLHLRTGQRAVDKSRRNACRRQRGDLVLHQGDQRRYHQGKPRQQQRRDLITQGFAAARRHNAQGVPPLQDRINQRLLPGAKRRMAKIFR